MIYEPVVEESNPLGMPKGSVRAIMALAIMVVGLALIVYLTVEGRADDMPREFYAVWAGVLGAYFIQRNGAAAAAEVKALRARVVNAELAEVDLLARVRAGDETIRTDDQPRPSWPRGYRT